MLKEGQVWYVSITYIVLREVGDEITMEKHQSKRQGKQVERIKTIRVKEGAKMKLLKGVLRPRGSHLQRLGRAYLR